MSPDGELLKLERAFMRALREPVFGDSRELTPLSQRAGRVSDEFHRTAERYIQSSKLLQPVERLELYHRQYWFRLLDSIAEDFPALRQLLGEQVFWNLIETYLETIPSQSYTLRHLGRQVADFLAQRPELAGTLTTQAVELARLEYAVCEVFEAVDHPVLKAEQIADTVLALQPSVKLSEFRTPVDALWSLPEEDLVPDELARPPANEPVFHVAVFREDYRIRVERLPCEAFRLLRAIQKTGSLETALQTSGLGGETPTDLAARVHDWFGTWMTRGWFCARRAASGGVSANEACGQTLALRGAVRGRSWTGQARQ